MAFFKKDENTTAGPGAAAMHPAFAGLPGAQREDSSSTEMAAMLLTEPVAHPRIGEKEVQKAAEILRRYKEGKANLENRIVEDELWWELRHWEAIGREKNIAGRAKPTSAWLFNSITNKHADAMDNFPEPVVLPRERDDEACARTLSSVLPVVLEYNDFEQTYSDNWYEKLKHGTAVYGVFWNSQKENGLGDIDIREIDLLKLFWEPGITDIQQSRNLFLVELVDNDLLEDQYEELRGKVGGNAVDIKKYLYDDHVDTSDKSVVVDWYYKTRSASGKTILHYAKFVGSTLLFASENEAQYQEVGWYAHGLYPVVPDVLFPEKGTPVGFGYVAICKDPQLYIDDLSARVLTSAMMQTTPRWFVSDNSGINREQLLNWDEPLVEVAGSLEENRLRQFTVNGLDGNVLNILQMKIDEMKDTSANRDVNSGSTGSGVTAAAAIAALQEAGNKTSRDMIAASYRAYTKIASMCIELMRQFYDETRSFRITGADGIYRFVEMNNAGLKDQVMSANESGVPMYRRPVFDLKIKAQKKNPFSRMEQNERAKELYQMGFFNPERAQESMAALDMMEFEGIDKVREQVKQGQTLLNMLQTLMMQMGVVVPQAGGGQTQPQAGRGQSVERKAANAERSEMTSYGQRLAARAAPNMDPAGSQTVPGA